jgi:hypothetical protein
MAEVQFDNDLAGLPREVADEALKNTAASVLKLLPSDASASLYQHGGTIARAAIAFYAGRKVGWALDITGDEATLIGGIGAIVLVVAWGIIKNRWAAWRTHEAAKASAAASAKATMMLGEPTAVALEPPPNKV